MIEPDELMCDVCHRPLDVVTGDDGETVDFWHASGVIYGEPHDPIPVPRVETEARVICDFCGMPDAKWRYPTRTFDTPDLALMDIALERPFARRPGVLTPRSVGDWCACGDCHDDIEAGLWNELADRGLRSKPRALRREVRPHVKRLHQQFRQNRTGEPRRIA